MSGKNIMCLNVSCQNSIAYLYVAGYFTWVSPCVGANCVGADLFAPTCQLRWNVKLYKKI